MILIGPVVCCACVCNEVAVLVILGTALKYSKVFQCGYTERTRVFLVVAHLFS